MRRKAVDTRKYNKIGTRKTFGRILIVFVLMAGLALFLLGRIVYLNKTKGATYEKKVLAQQSYSSKEINYCRGDITDRNGNKLATSKKVYDLVLDPLLIRTDKDFVEATAGALEKAFGITRAKFDKILEKQADSHYYVMEKYKGVSRSRVKDFKALQEKDKDIKGVTFDERYERYYPYSTAASKIVGFCSSDNR